MIAQEAPAASEAVSQACRSLVKSEKLGNALYREYFSQTADPIVLIIARLIFEKETQSSQLNFVPTAL